MLAASCMMSPCCLIKMFLLVFLSVGQVACVCACVCVRVRAYVRACVICAKTFD
jgi:hypothetical protein